MAILSQCGAGLRRTERGFSMIELMIVLATCGVISAIALPQLASMRRVQRAAALPQLVKTELRLARQQALTQRQAMTFRYDDTLKQISIIDSAGVQSRPISLIGDGLVAGDIKYGATPLVTAPLDDGTTLSSLSSNRIDIAFQPDGSVVGAGGLPVNYALYFYNPNDTSLASAVSVLGSSGRVKTWRYPGSGNKFLE